MTSCHLFLTFFTVVITLCYNGYIGCYLVYFKLYQCSDDEHLFAMVSDLGLLLHTNSRVFLKLCDPILFLIPFSLVAKVRTLTYLEQYVHRVTDREILQSPTNSELVEDSPRYDFSNLVRLLSLP